jgi:hypothetical protein
VTSHEVVENGVHGKFNELGRESDEKYQGDVGFAGDGM